MPRQQTKPPRRLIAKLHGIKNSFAVRPSVHPSRRARAVARALLLAKKGPSPLPLSLSRRIIGDFGDGAALRRNPRQSILVPPARVSQLSARQDHL